METIIRLSQKAYAICIIAVGIQQLAYGNINSNFLPAAFSSGIVYKLFAYPWGIAFTLSGIAYLINKKAFEISLISGGIFLAFFLFAYAPYLIFFDPNGNQLLTWAPAVEDLAFTGSSFILAASFSTGDKHPSGLTRFLEKFIPFGGIFFSVMLIVYGIDHFVYSEFVSAMVPSWISKPYFWTYFAGVALIGAGLAIIFKIKLRIVGSLLGIMIFLWLIILHIPRAIADPLVEGGLELTRVFIAIGFTGISFLLAFNWSESSAEFNISSSGPRS
ncbi:MAG TPA: hypothetical protein VMI12_08135 [Puia sp.]|nr:hypothetical protein [Puia sp.]